jgi:hypothetical protein
VEFGRRVLRKSVRKATPGPVREAMYPGRAVKNTVTPRPVKQASRAVYALGHPVGAAQNKLIDSALNACMGRRGNGTRRNMTPEGFWSSLVPWRHGRTQPSSVAAPDTVSRGDVLRFLKLGAHAEARGKDLVLLHDGRERGRKTFSSAEDAAVTAWRVNQASAAWRQQESGVIPGRPASRRVPRSRLPRPGPGAPVESSEISPAGELELEVRRHVGLGGDWRQPEAD